MRILLLEDSKSSRLMIQQQLITLGHDVDAVENGQQGFLKATSNQYDLFICDLLMPHWDGFKFMEAMQAVCPHLPVVVISSTTQDEHLEAKLAPYDNIIASLGKPFNIDQLDAILQKIRTQASDSVRKLARIVCTIGPASQSSQTIGRMVLAGMDVARLNFSHGSHEQHKKHLLAIRKAEEEWGRPIAILMDLCGPKIRTGLIKDNKVILRAGYNIVIQAEAIEGTEERISTISPEILPDLRVGDPVLLDDGQMELKVIQEGDKEVVCQVVVGGKLSSNKGINLPETPLSVPCLTDKDRLDLEWGLNHSVDFVALSFVRNPEDIMEVKEIIAKSGMRALKVVAKIEKPEAVERICEIIEVSDVIMIARGDLGVEIPAAKVPRIQQKIIKLCWEQNTPVITATQMLESMTENTRPTRAEVTDVSMAIKEGTDAVMLSGETAAGIDPLNVVRTMASIICEEERHSILSFDLKQFTSSRAEINPALIAAASLGEAAATMVLDFGGQLYRYLSKWNRQTPTLLVTNSVHVARHSCIFKNVMPIIIKDKLSRDQMVFRALDEAKQRGYLVSGDTLAILEGKRLTQGGIPQVGAFQLVKVD